MLGKRDIIAIGGGDQFSACKSIIEQEYNIIGIIEKSKTKNKHGVKVLGDDSVIPDYNSKRFVITIGQVIKNDARKNMFDWLLKLGIVPETIISERSCVDSESVGQGSMIMNYSIVGSGAHIGDNCIINNCAVVEHDVYIGDNVHVCPNATIVGNKYICNDVTIAAGAVVINDILEPGFYAGNPAKKKEFNFK